MRLDDDAISSLLLKWYSQRTVLGICCESASGSARVSFLGRVDGLGESVLFRSTAADGASVAVATSCIEFWQRVEVGRNAKIPASHAQYRPLLEGKVIFGVKLTDGGVLTFMELASSDGGKPIDESSNNGRVVGVFLVPSSLDPAKLAA